MPGEIGYQLKIDKFELCDLSKTVSLRFSYLERTKQNNRVNSSAHHTVIRRSEIAIRACDNHLLKLTII